MSRIDEALRRVLEDGARPEPMGNSQHQFLPAWPLSDATTGSRAPNGTSEAIGTLDGTNERSSGPSGSLHFSSSWNERLALGPSGDPGLIEQFRRLATTLHHAHSTNGLRSVMVTSALPGDGKTLTAVNLALVLAESYRYNVLLVDADLRRPSIPRVMDLSEGSGLSEALRAPADQKLALVPITPRLTLLPAGQPIANSIEALTSPRMRLILEEATSHFDWLVLDAPPVGSAADARLLTQMVGGTLLVVRAGMTQCQDVQKAADAIGREQILGVVLNGVDRSDSDGYYYYGDR